MISLSEIVKELNIQKKGIYGQGAYHNVYPLKNHPDKVVKISQDEKNWKYTLQQLETFKNHPNLFPKVYKITDKYAVIEKLNDKKAREDIKKAFSYLMLLNYENDSSLSLVNYMKHNDNFTSGIYDFKGEHPEKYNKAFKELEDILVDRNQQVLYTLIRFNEFINKIYDELDNSYVYDIHDYQFAYDSNNNIKLVDF